MSLWTALFGPISNDRFARSMIRAIRDAGESGQISYDAEGFVLRLADGSVMALANAYQEYCQVPRRARQSVLDRYAALATQMRAEDSTFEAIKGDLLPRVRERIYWKAVRIQMELQSGKPLGPNDLPPLQEINERLSVELVIDTPVSIRSVTKNDLSRWKMTFEEVLAVAKENLWARSNEEFRQVANGLYASPWTDNHDASRLFLYDLIWQLKVKGDHVAAVPNRDVLLVTGSDDAEGLQRMAMMVEEAMKLPHPITSIPMRLIGERWVQLELPVGHPAYWAIERLALMNDADEYATQKQLLEAIHTRTGQEVYVANYSAVQKADGPECVSYAAWSEGVESLLPRTSEIALMQQRGSTLTMAARVRWEHVKMIAGDLMEPQGMYPERYRVRQFPTPEQISQMKALQGE